MKKILLVLGHPRIDSFCGALADSYQKGVLPNRGNIKRINLIQKDFDYNMIAGKNDKTFNDDVGLFQQDILRADHLVFVYPTWWYNMPAILKAFLDRTFLSGFAYKYEKGSLIPKALLKGRTAHIIITADGPSIYYTLFGNPAIKVMKMTLAMCGIRVTKITKVRGVRRLSDQQRKNKLQDAFHSGEDMI